MPADGGDGVKVSPTIAIVDCGMGNLFSVEAACRHVGLDARVTDDPSLVRGADGVVLPGVGAFGEAMQRLGQSGLDVAVSDVVAGGRPFLAVCLGLQLLFESSEEFGASSGLGILAGQVVKFPTEADGVRLKVPAVGWLQAERVPRTGETSWNVHPFTGLSAAEYFYFVHSFYVKPSDLSNVATRTTYSGITYVSSLMHRNIFACQFHPERSGAAGLQIYRNFADSLRSLDD